MIVSNIRLDIPNGRVVKLAERVKGTQWMTRKEIREWIEEHINDIIDGGEEALKQPSPATERVAVDEPSPERDRSVCQFVPSRGDEDYLFKTSDPELKAILTRLLDASDELEAYTWQQLEKIRE